MTAVVPVGTASLSDVLSYAASGVLAISFVVVVVSGVRMAFRPGEKRDGPLPVLLGFIAAGSVSMLVAALL